jgi:hypothetical protein
MRDFAYVIAAEVAVFGSAGIITWLSFNADRTIQRITQAIRVLA